MLEIYKKHIEESYERAIEYKSKLTEDVLALEGMSGRMTRHFYNNMLTLKDARYLEIGTWKGASLCAAMYGNSAKIYCIDNWSEFGGPKAEFLTNFVTYRGDNDASVIESDCFEVNVRSLPRFNIYMYDGNHSSLNHYRALNQYYDCVDDLFIYIVDDWNIQEVREGTNAAIKDKRLNVLYEKEIRMTWDNSHTPMEEARKFWWNGIYIAILQKRPQELSCTDK